MPDKAYAPFFLPFSIHKDDKVNIFKNNGGCGKDSYYTITYKFHKDNYSSHCARDTFISICVTQGIDFKTILEWTGQTSYTVMDRYIFTTDEYKAGQMSKAFSEGE